MFGFGIYDPASYDLVIAGHLIEGFADDKPVSIVRDTPLNSDKVGIMGDVVVVESRDNRAKCTLNLVSSSMSNDLLTAMAMSRVKGPFLLKDKHGATMVKSLWSWISKIPTIEVSAKDPSRQYEIRLANASFFVGGVLSPAASM